MRVLPPIVHQFRECPPPSAAMKLPLKPESIKLQPAIRFQPAVPPQTTLLAAPRAEPCPILRDISASRPGSRMATPVHFEALVRFVPALVEYAKHRKEWENRGEKPI